MQSHANEDYQVLVETFAEYPKSCVAVIAVTLVLLCSCLAEMLTSSTAMKVGGGICSIFRGLIDAVFYVAGCFCTGAQWACNGICSIFRGLTKAVVYVAGYFCTAAMWVFNGVFSAAEWVGSAMDFVQCLLCWPFLTVWTFINDFVHFTQQLSRTATAKASEASTWLWAKASEASTCLWTKFCMVLMCVFVWPVVLTRDACICIGTWLLSVLCTVFMCTVVFPVKCVYDTGVEIVTLSVVLLCATVKSLFVLLLVPFHIGLWMKRVGTQIVWAEFCSLLDRLHKYIQTRKKIARKKSKANTSDFTHRFKNLYYLLVAGGLALAWWWIMFLVHTTVLHVTEFDCVHYITGHRWTADITFATSVNVAVNSVKNVFMHELKRSGIMQNAFVQVCMRRIMHFMRALFAPMARQATHLYGFIALPAVQWPAFPVLPAWPGLPSAVKVRKL